MITCLSGRFNHHWLYQGTVWTCRICGELMPPERAANTLKSTHNRVDLWARRAETPPHSRTGAADPAEPAEIAATVRTGRKTPGKSGYWGVTYLADKGWWTARICVDRRQMHLGIFHDAIAAARAYDEAVKRLGVKTAMLNGV